MSIQVELADVKLLAYEEGTSNDTAIAAMISLFVSAIEERLDGSLISDTGCATWANLAAAKIIAGEWVARRERLTDAGSTTVDSTTGVLLADQRDDPSGLITAGWNALLPYIKDELFLHGAAEMLCCPFMEE